MNNLSKIITGLAAGSFLLLGLGLMAQCARAEMAPGASTTNATRNPSLADFDLIAQRNIFDPNRGVASARTPVASASRQAVVETFSFRGAAEKVGKGFDGFFIGYGTPASGVLVVNDMINGFKVAAIGLREVRLIDPTGEVVTLTDETGLRREDGGPWTKVAAPTLYTAATRVRVTPNQDDPQPVSRPANVPNQNNGRRNRNGSRYNNQGGGGTSQDDPGQASPPLARQTLTPFQGVLPVRA